MVHRKFWVSRIEQAWKRRPVVWLSGVRRAGKTVLCQSLERVEYFDCELPRVRHRLEDPEGFLEEMRGKRVVLDEVHRLPNPAEILKIAADHYPDTRLLATGSSSLQASTKFRDTLTGRKEEVWLTPMMSVDLQDFGAPNLVHRLRQGGLPPFFLSRGFPERDFQEWMDAYWAKDIQELFRLEKRTSFQRFVELLIMRSGGIFEATAYAAPCEISRTTVTNYLNVLEATRVAHIIRPFSTRRSTEILSAPKVYAFDTGFIHYYSGWQDLRPEDLGLLWESYVLNELQARAPDLKIRYWRDTRGHEVDFLLLRRGRAPIALECKWTAGTLDPANLRAFRSRYPKGENWVVARDVSGQYRRSHRDLTWTCLSLDSLLTQLLRLSSPPRPSH